jgi:predicted nucleic acid-binding protein
MPEVFANTTPLQYLHQLRLLHLLPEFYSIVFIPEAVSAELATGLAHGVDVPVVSDHPWLHLRSAPAPSGPLPADIHRGEAAVLSLASLSPAPLLLLDDAAARRYASSMALPFTGTLGVLIRAFREGRITEIAVVLDRLEALGFRLAPATRAEALRLAVAS